MAKKRKKTGITETERYEIEIEDWEVYSHFGINMGRKKFFPGDYREHSKLSIHGNILSPLLKIASKAKIEIIDSPEFDDHWKEAEAEKPPFAIGWMEVPRGDNTLQMDCWIPTRLFNYISIAIASEKIKYASIFGTKLKWRRGDIFDITFSTIREEY